MFPEAPTKKNTAAAWSGEHHTGGLHGIVRPPLGMLVAATSVRLGAADHELKEAPGWITWGLKHQNLD